MARDAPHKADPPAKRISLRKRLAFTATSVIIGLLVLEAAARALLRWTPNPRWEYQSRHVRTIGFPTLNDILIPDPTRFWRLKPDVDRLSVRGHVAGATLDFTLSTDGRGCRRMPDVPDASRTVLFLGDSCTLGVGVNDDQTIPFLVQQRLPRTRCLNAGAPGYTAYQGRVTLAELGPDLHPGVVVICFGFNDDQSWDDAGDAEHARRIRDGSARWTNQFGLARLCERALHRPPMAQGGAAGARPRLTDGEFADEIAAMIDWCRNHGATPVLVVWPLRAQLTAAALTSKQILLRRMTEQRHVPCVDLVETFRAQADPALFADLIHASPAGCDVAADALVRTLDNRAE